MDREDNCRRASYRLNLYGFLPKGSYLGIARDKFQPQPMQIGTVVFCRDWKVPTIHPFYSWSQADQGQLLGLLGALMKLIFLLLLESRQTLRLSLLGTSPWERKLQSTDCSQKLEPGGF
jgi:hypothetical protein